MNDILIINDGPTHGVEAGEYAFMVAKMLRKNLLVVNISHLENAGGQKKQETCFGKE
jgi:hypothetical protein